MNSDRIDRSEVTFHSGDFFFEDKMEEPGFEFACLRGGRRHLKARPES